MNPFALHPRLERDCHRLGRLPGSHLLLHQNASLPWLILVPEVEETELFQLAEPIRSSLQREIDAIARFVMSHFVPVEKINVAAIGNLVPQLHVHVVGRHPGDACWPDPVWGNLASESKYALDELRSLRTALAESLREPLTFRPEE